MPHTSAILIETLKVVIGNKRKKKAIMNTYEIIEDEDEDESLKKRVAGILDRTTPFDNEADRLAALAVAAFESYGVGSMIELVIEEKLSFWGLTAEAAAAAVMAAKDAGKLIEQSVDQSIRIMLAEFK